MNEHAEYFKQSHFWKSYEIFGRGDIASFVQNSRSKRLTAAEVRAVIKALRDELVIHTVRSRGICSTRYCRMNPCKSWVVRKWRNPIPEVDWDRFNPRFC